MKKLARLFLLCLMMIAIPVQAIAATAMFYCGATHHEVTTVSDNDAHHSSDKVSHSSSDECSSCATCCIGCAMAIESPDFAVPYSSPEKINLRFSSHVDHVSDGLERPPRA